MYDSPDVDRLRASLTSSEVRSRIYTEGARAWPEVSRFLADGRRDWLERVAIAERFIDLYGDDAMVERMIQAAEMNATIAESIAEAHLGDMSGTGVDRLSDWQFPYQLARDEGLNTGSDQAPGAVNADPTRYQLAQVNIGCLVAPVDSVEIAEFMAALDPINRLADGSPGFIWRLQTADGNATAIHSFDDDLIISNMSVWESIESLRAFVYTSAHSVVMRRRREWFEKYVTSYMALWWVPAGHRPTIEEAKERLALLDRLGPTADAFTFREPFESPVS